MPTDKDGNNYTIPGYLGGCFVPTGDHSPFRDMYRVIVPSGQMWMSLTPSQKEEYKEIIRKRMKEDPEDYIHRMRAMLPQNPKGAK